MGTVRTSQTAIGFLCIMLFFNTIVLTLLIRFLVTGERSQSEVQKTGCAVESSTGEEPGDHVWAKTESNRL